MIPLAVVVFATTLSTSCSEEYVSPVVGTWLQTSSSTEEFTNNVSDGITSDTFDADNVFRITFNADGTFNDFSSYSYTDNGDVIVETSTDSGTYSTFGNLLTVTYDGDTETAEFTLSGTHLGIVHIEEFTENGDQKRLVTIATYIESNEHILE